MNISKLTITPIFPKTASIVIDYPSTERAFRLISERLQTKNNNIEAVPFRVLTSKLPKYLKKFVNLKTYVGTVYSK